MPIYFSRRSNQTLDIGLVARARRSKELVGAELHATLIEGIRYTTTTKEYVECGDLPRFCARELFKGRSSRMELANSHTLHEHNTGGRILDFFQGPFFV